MGLNTFLKYGVDKKFFYGDPVVVKDIIWKDAKAKFIENLRMSINRVPSNSFSFCGGMTACSFISLINKNVSTWSVDIGIDTEKMSKLLNSENHMVKVENLEEILIEINKLSDFPRASLEDVYAYSRQKNWSKVGNSGVCEGGVKFLLLGSDIYNGLMNLAISRGDYKISKARKFILPEKIKKSNYENLFDSYTDCFNACITIFQDHEIVEFGLEPEKITLKNDTLEDFLIATFEWGYKTVYEYRTKVLASHFNMTHASPLINDPEMVDFCLSLPIEMKYCLGNESHILKESILFPENIKEHMAQRIYPYIYKTIKPGMQILINKYLRDKNRKLFNHLDYDIVQKHLGNYVKAWNLLSLAVWMEIHDGKI